MGIYVQVLCPRCRILKPAEVLLETSLIEVWFIRIFCCCVCLNMQVCVHPSNSDSNRPSYRLYQGTCNITCSCGLWFQAGSCRCSKSILHAVVKMAPDRKKINKWKSEQINSIINHTLNTALIKSSVTWINFQPCRLRVSYVGSVMTQSRRARTDDLPICCNFPSTSDMFLCTHIPEPRKLNPD